VTVCERWTLRNLKLGLVDWRWIDWWVAWYDGRFAFEKLSARTQASLCGWLFSVADPMSHEIDTVDLTMDNEGEDVIAYGVVEGQQKLVTLVDLTVEDGIGCDVVDSELQRDLDCTVATNDVTVGAVDFVVDLTDLVDTSGESGKVSALMRRDEDDLMNRAVASEDAPISRVVLCSTDLVGVYRHTDECVCSDLNVLSHRCELCNCSLACVNAAMSMECDKSNCSTGTSCCNRWLDQPPQAFTLAMTSSMGIGLFATQEFSKDEIVIEYVGEYVSTSTYERKIACRPGGFSRIL
jgi:hypothetical protein